LTRSRVLTSLLVPLVCATAACTEDPIAAVDSDAAPGFSTPTIEIYLESGELEWRDTTYWGFALPSTAGFTLIASEPDLRSRPLGRVSTIPDSLFVDSARVAIDSFTTAAFRISMDTARSSLPARDP